MPEPLVLRRRLAAPPERVFAAWTEPALLAQWMSPFAAAEAETDVRVGGAFSIIMLGQGQAIRHTGTYLEVVPPRRLVFTWQSPYTGPDPSVVSVSIEAADDGGSELVLVHDRLSAAQIESHRGGWAGILDNLATLLELPTWT